MANQSDIRLQNDTVKLVGTGASPVVDIQGGNNWKLSNSDGDLRIGNSEHMLTMGVALDGGGAGNAQLGASGDLKLVSGGSSIVRISDDGIDTQGGLTADGDIDTRGGLTAQDTIKTYGNLMCLDGGGGNGGWGWIQKLLVGGIAFNLQPHQGGENMGSSSKRWGTLYAKNVNQSSDRRLKTDIQDLDGGLDAVLNLRPVSYAWRENGDGTHLGLIGQEVADVLPEVVNTPDENGYLGLDYSELVAVLIDAVQEQQSETEELEAQVDQQQGRIEEQQEHIQTQQDQIHDLEAHVDDLEQRLAALERTP